MNWKTLILCGVLFASAILTARAADPITYKEIAMLLRNGEQPQFIINDMVRRKLLQPLSPDEEDDLVSLGAPPALINALRSPANLAAPEATSAYNMHLREQKMTALQQQVADQNLAAQAAAAARAQQQHEAQAAAQPAAQHAADEFAGKPMGMKFTAADGSQVDIAALHGKVVLVDFWATWSGPSMDVVPDVVAAYKKYHDKGFEIIGISLDQDKDTMLNATQQKEMTWPQYFDGKGWKNEIISRLHIKSLPALWLVNKNGIIATTAAHENLDANIAKLLAE